MARLGIFLMKNENLQIKQLLMEPDGPDDRIYTALTHDGRIFVGGWSSGEWQWQELPPITPDNIKYIGGQVDSPFYKAPK